MYLVDTNIWLERLLNQDQSDEVGRFLDTVSSGQLYVTDFSFHSICVILTRLGHSEVLVDFVGDVFVEAGVNLVSLAPEATTAVVNEIKQNNLDFDDAYQYVVAERNSLTLVSFDADFDRTPRGRTSPARIVYERATDGEGGAPPHES